MKLNNNFFETIIAKSPVPTFIKDKDSAFLYINELASAMFQISAKDMIGKKDHDFFPHDQADYFKSIDEEVLRTGMIREVEEELTVFGNNTRTLLTRKARVDVDEESYILVTLHDITELREAEKLTRYMAFHDSLTGLPNRKALTEFLIGIIKKQQEFLVPPVLLLIDLDGFKEVNDSYGHEAGDEVLRQFSEALRSVIAPEDMVARLGGDEFAVISFLNIKSFNQISEEIVSKAAAPFSVAGVEVFIGASIGASTISGSSLTVRDILKRSDTALYNAKESGKGKSLLYSVEMETASLLRLRIKEELIMALQSQDEFYCVYLPVISANDNSLINVEALARWKSPILGEVLPELFIAVAEETGLINELGELLIKKALNDIAKINGISLSMNISAVQLKNKDFSRILLGLIAEYNFKPTRLQLEIAETAILIIDESSQRQLTFLRENGVKIIIDAFGTGYSSLKLLGGLTLDKIKIDRSFISGSHNEEECASIITALAHVGSSLGLEVIAGGVETAFQKETLIKAGCTAQQGFYFSHPLRINNLMSYIRDNF